MIFWTSYFIAVTYFQLFSAVSAHAFLNLGLCLFIFFPLPKTLASNKKITVIRSVIAVILGFILLWHESYLPAPITFWNFLVSPDLRPSPIFIWNFLLSALNIKIIIFLVPTLFFAYALSRTKLKKYFPVFFILVFFIIGFTEQTTTYDDLIGNFYNQESNKVIKLAAAPNNDFDIVILQLCSFSWADFNYIKYDTKPFFTQFDYIFTDFNSATSYSNPAIIRLLRSTCGQTPEETLFTDVNDDCYLATNLRKLGYSTYTALNHDGAYSGFNDVVVKYGRSDKPLDISKLKPVQTSFDGSPIYDDYDALAVWQKARETDSNKKVAVFYNSITLHTGGRYLSNDYLTNGDQYSLALKNVVSDLDKFFTDIKKTNKKTIVIIIGEHGAALKGSALQPGTVREIPLPDITRVPVAIKLFGPEFNDKPGAAVTINQPSTYFSLIEVLSQIMKTQTIGAVKISDSRLVSDNEKNIVVENNLGLFFRLKKYKTWNLIPGSILK
jgi:cellulose synthase operon protein YhjU